MPTSALPQNQLPANGLADLSLHDPPLTFRFSVTAPTQYGESILLSGDTPPLGEFDTNRAIALSYEHPGIWACTVQYKYHKPPIQYKFCRRQTDGTLVWEPAGVRQIPSIPFCSSSVLIRDQWKYSPQPERDIFSTDAFTKVIFKANKHQRTPERQAKAKAEIVACEANVKAKGGFVVRFGLFAQRVLPDEELVLYGDVEELRNGVVLNDVHYPLWECHVAFRVQHSRMVYWYKLRKKAGGVVQEDTQKRVLTMNEQDMHFLGVVNGVGMVVVDDFFAFEQRWRASGVALPVFAIRSERGCGVGEFADLKRVIDFCVSGGMSLVQLLPINDTLAGGGEKDSYPYSAISSFALHPIYLSLEDIGLGGDVEFERERERLNKKSVVDFCGVVDVKMRLVRRVYEKERETFLQDPEFLNWFEENQEWLVPYALFKFFMHVNGTSCYDLWGNRKSVTREEMTELAKPESFHFDYLGMTYFTQFHLHKQLAEAAKYASDRGIVFKGDLPIGVNRYCVDTWVNPHLFRLNMQAGAPPDFFSTNGQNWSFPTYDWEAMRKDNYGWWKARLGHMAKYFHAYRIDHILGLFRIWEIPISFRTGISGRFFPAHAFSRQELEAQGLWDFERFVKPYVRDGLLQELFHENWWKIKDRFFERSWEDRLQFKEEYNTEKKVEKALMLPLYTPKSERDFNEDVKIKLFSLLNNVCLVADIDNPDLFHPRFQLFSTSSFAELPSNEWKERLHHLHDDYMYRRQDELWRANGLERLPMLKSASNMLVCGEDLGFIPDCVPSVMQQTSILSLAVQRMPAGDAEFGIPAEYKYECVATTSSHDTSTFRGWWEEIPSDMRWRYWTQHMKRHGYPPEHCTTETVQWAVEDHLRCDAMWVIFPIQDLLGMDNVLRRQDVKAEQINDPSNPDHIWNYRMHITIDEILDNAPFMHKLFNLNTKYSRYCKS